MLDETLLHDLMYFLKKQDIIFLKFEINDFREKIVDLVLMGKEETLEITIPENLRTFVGILSNSLFIEQKKIITWDIKKLFSHFYFHLPRHYFLNIKSKIIDLKYLEGFLGKNEKIPQTFVDAQRRAMVILDNKNIHWNLHIPLATKVLPKIETVGLLDSEKKKKCYAVYEIEGSKHGRLSCKKEFDDGISLHNMSDEKLAVFKPRMDHMFLKLDYKAYEVRILQYLSQDERLGKIIASEKDIYSTIYSLFYGKCDGKRQFIKDSFLPIVFGMQSQTLSERMNLSKEEADDLISKVNLYFETAMKWVVRFSEEAKTKEIKDHFGRTRKFEEYWKVRNFVIQSPAAIVSQEKLISLYEGISDKADIVGNVHDCYFLEVHRNLIYDVAYHASKILESDSVFCPGLKLKLEMKVGIDLGNMSLYNL